MHLLFLLLCPLFSVAYGVMLGRGRGRNASEARKIGAVAAACIIMGALISLFPASSFENSSPALLSLLRAVPYVCYGVAALSVLSSFVLYAEGP